MMECPKLRVTYGDLQRRVKSLDIQESSQGSGQLDVEPEDEDAMAPPQQEKKGRRPDRAIYRPGHMKPVKSPPNPTAERIDSPENGRNQHMSQKDNSVVVVKNSSLTVSPLAPGQRFGPRRKTNRAAPVTAPPDSIKSDEVVADDSDELMLDADSMVAPSEEEPERLPPRFNSRRSNSQPSNHLQRAERPTKSSRQQTPSDSVSQRREEVDVPHRTSRGRTNDRMSSDHSRDVKKPTPDPEEKTASGDDGAIYNRKVDLGGNMKITCHYSTKTSPLKEQLENEKLKEETLPVPGNESFRKSPRGKLHSVIKAREQYNSGSSAGADEKIDSFGKFASESDNWDSEMEKADYQLQTMVISSSKNRGRGTGSKGDRSKDERGQQIPGAKGVQPRKKQTEGVSKLRRPRSQKFVPDPIENEDFFWDEDFSENVPAEKSDHSGIRGTIVKKDGREIPKQDRHSGMDGENAPKKPVGEHHATNSKLVKGRGHTGGRLRQDSDSSEEMWHSRNRKGHDARVSRVRQESGNSRSSDDHHSDSDRRGERPSKGGGLLRVDGRSTPKDIPGKRSRPPREPARKNVPSSSRSRSPPQSPKLRDKGKDKMLWDPSKPNQKPALEQKHADAQLLFIDSDSDPQNSPARDPAAYYQGFDSNAYQQPPQPGYPPQTSSSWADQAEPNFAYPPPGAVPQPTGVSYGPYYNVPLPPTQNMNFDPQQIAAMHGKRAKEQAAMQVVLEAATKETEFSDAVAQGVGSKGNLTAVLSIRKELERLYEGIVLLDLQISSQYNIEQLLWKNAYYQLCELLKKDKFAADSAYKDAMIELLQNGTSFYEELLEKLQSTYCFKLDNKTGLDPLHEEPRRTIKLAILSAQRCMIALGDIARYKELAHGTSNYGRARSWYTKAQRLAPRNGKPYNQLAILALYTRRKLDAVYYYMRSLAASNPFITARESLMTLFEEVRKKIEQKEQEMLRLKREKDSSQKHPQQQRRRGQGIDDSYRKEIWINIDGSRSGMDDMEERINGEPDERELQKMPPAELNKRFVLSFLNVHGKLFTKIGMEAFSHAAGNLLKEFSALLSQSPSPIASTRLLQLMAINMFAVENTNVKDGVSEGEDMRPYLQELAVQLVLDMFIVLVHRCCQHLTNDLQAQSKDQCLSEDLHEMLPAVKVVADWMMCHPEYWNPPPNVNEEHAVSTQDIWEAIALFLNILKDYKEFGVDFMPECEDSEEILLPEDHMLSGFVPLLALPLRPLYVDKNVDKMLAMDSIRITSLKLFGEFIYGQEKPLITFDGSKNCYVSVAPKTAPTSEERGQETRRHSHRDGDDDDVEILESYTDEEDGDIEDTHVSHLRERRHSLEKQLIEQQRKQAQIQDVIERQRQQRDLIIEINPGYLIPDTNCFIDHLPAIEELVASQRYSVTVPLVVINELDGLSRGIRDDSAKLAASQQVAEAAADAIDFLERTFDVRNRHLKAMTSKGTLLNTIAYRSEESKRIGTNDDLILKCCMHYCDDHVREYMPSDKDAPIKVHRTVVLLTNDRNLRVKAIQQNVPTREVMAFLRWAKG